jgi:hypothetical protein
MATRSSLSEIRSSMPPDASVESQYTYARVWHQMALNDLALFLTSQGVEDRAQLFAGLPEDGFSSSFGNE